MASSRILREIEETQAILSRLAKSLEDARNHADPFGAFVFEQRRLYRLFQRDDHSKSGKRTKEWTEHSYLESIQMGFKGDYMAWMHLLRAYTPKVADPDRQ